MREMYQMEFEARNALGDNEAKTLLERSLTDVFCDHSLVYKASQVHLSHRPLRPSVSSACLSFLWEVTPSGTSMP